MKVNTKTKIEYLLLLALPAAIFVGCAGTSEDNAANHNALNHALVKYEQSLDAHGMVPVTVIETPEIEPLFEQITSMN